MVTTSDGELEQVDVRTVRQRPAEQMPAHRRRGDGGYQLFSLFTGAFLIGIGVASLGKLPLFFQKHSQTTAGIGNLPTYNEPMEDQEFPVSADVAGAENSLLFQMPTLPRGTAGSQGERGS